MWPQDHLAEKFQGPPSVSVPGRYCGKSLISFWVRCVFVRDYQAVYIKKYKVVIYQRNDLKIIKGKNNVISHTQKKWWAV